MLFLKATTKMKTSIKLLTVGIALSLTGASLFISKKATAIYEPPKKYKVISCTISEEGEVIMQGNRCESGSAACSSNPCY